MARSKRIKNHMRILKEKRILEYYVGVIERKKILVWDN